MGVGVGLRGKSVVMTQKAVLEIGATVGDIPNHLICNSWTGYSDIAALWQRGVKKF